MTTTPEERLFAELAMQVSLESQAIERSFENDKLDKGLALIDHVAYIEKFLEKIKSNSTYRKASNSYIVCLSCKCRFIKKSAEFVHDTYIKSMCKHITPYADDIEYANYKMKRTSYICPHCGFKGFYTEDCLGEVKDGKHS